MNTIRFTGLSPFTPRLNRYAEALHDPEVCMRITRHPLIVILLVILFLAAAALLGTPRALAEVDPTAGIPDSHPELQTPLTLLPVADPPAAVELDTCQHCHLSGSIENMWTPLARWSVVGLGGFVFAFGVFRAGSTFVTRKRWQPLWMSMVDWLDRRFQLVGPMKKVLGKPVPLYATRWMYCLGGITFTLLVIQGITGILLAFYYKPTPEQAYASIQFIENEVRYGAAIRAIHHWSANGTVVMVVAHMLRVFIHGAFKAPRELNWVSGVFLLLLTLGFGLTGYLLPWDQRAYWATTVASEIMGAVPQIGDVILVFVRGGWDVTATTLSRFYALHILVLPVIVVVFLGAHFLMVRRQGISRPL
jgi:hypothetical protein